MNTIERKEKGYQASAGTVIWWSVSGSIPVEKINAALEKRGLKPFAKMPNPKSIFHTAWRQFGAARYSDYIPRLVFSKRITTGNNPVYKEVIGLIHESVDADAEKLDLNQYGALVFAQDLNQKTANLFYRCGCGKKYHHPQSNFCSCGADIPKLATKIFHKYNELSTNLGSGERGGQLLGFAYSLGVISLSGTGRPFYTPEEIAVDGSTPENQKGNVENFIDAIREWGDTAHCLPLRADGIEEVKEFSYLAIKGELDAINEEMTKWSEKTRVSTKQKRIETLLNLNTKIEMYSRVLGDSEAKLKEITESLSSRLKEELNI